MFGDYEILFVFVRKENKPASISALAKCDCALFFFFKHSSVEQRAEKGSDLS